MSPFLNRGDDSPPVPKGPRRCSSMEHLRGGTYGMDCHLRKL